MKVNVFTRAEGADNDQLLAVPTQRYEAVPPKFHKRWQYFAKVDTSDAMFRSVKVEEEISAQGYCVFFPVTQGRRAKNASGLGRMEVSIDVR